MKYGLEKECLVFDNNYNPYQFENKKFDQNQTLDFCDHQIELVSDVCSSIEELHYFMNKLANQKYPRDGIIWPISPNPCFSNFTQNSPNLHDKPYHHYLVDKYPTEMLLTSGIHFNVSGFNSSLIDMCQKIYTFAPIILPFFSFSPKKDTMILSSRNTNEFGYYNEQNFNLDFTSLDTYNQCITDLISNGNLKEKRELYSRIRIKNNEYLELRFIDLNPKYLIGISYEQLKLLETFLIYLDSISINNFDFKDCVENFDQVAMNGRNLEIELTIDGKTTTLYNHIMSLLEAMVKINPQIIEPFISDFEENRCDFQQVIYKFVNIGENICDLGKYYAHFYKTFTPLFPESKMELSSKIVRQEAINEGCNLEILSDYDNVMSINNHLVVQATKTNLDHYADIMMLDNKVMTKLILAKNNIVVPSGIAISDIKELDTQSFIGKKIVVKPQDTNFGTGISILEDNWNYDQLLHAINYAFKFGDRVIVEEFISGKEFRFLVVDGKCISVIHRDACNVVGDGIHSIKELIDVKNNNPLRGYHYQKPLEKIKIDVEMEIILSEQNLKLSSILSKDQKVYLRKNSNVSTGGDTYEVSDYIPQYFKDIACQATKAMNVKICGVDMIIPNIYVQDYAIIEANYNPAIHMHAYPLYGIGRNPAKNIIRLLTKGE